MALRICPVALFVSGILSVSETWILLVFPDSGVANELGCKLDYRLPHVFGSSVHIVDLSPVIHKLLFMPRIKGGDCVLQRCLRLFAIRFFRVFEFRIEMDCARHYIENALHVV